MSRFHPYASAWEAVFTADFTLEQARRRVAPLARNLAAKGRHCLVAYDTRFMGQAIARAIAHDLSAQGGRVTIASAPAPLPAVRYALDTGRADCALVVSARNRPAHYNGLLLYRGPAFDITLTLTPDADPPPPLAFPIPGELPADQAFDLRQPYLDHVRARLDLDAIRRGSLTMFVDAMGGTLGNAVTALLGESGQTRAIEINRDPDPLFGRVTPLPREAGLTRLKKLVRESDSHLGLAFSADGTALAVVDKNGVLIETAAIALLLAAYLARQYRQRGAVVIPADALGDVVFTAWEDAVGLKVEPTADPAERVEALLAHERRGLLVGCSYDGELIVGSDAASPDALLAGMYVAELVARSGGNLRTLLDTQREQLKA
jgi:phosphomannomutase